MVGASKFEIAWLFALGSSLLVFFGLTSALLPEYANSGTFLYEVDRLFGSRHGFLDGIRRIFTIFRIITLDIFWGCSHCPWRSSTRLSRRR